jgi:HD-like signal output (HDOD) protein/DNA-binding NarL/FixJ family response regulator
MTTASTSGDVRERILIIDDEEGIRNALQRAITRGGYESFTACDGVEGLAQAVEVKPAVIIVDLRMPKMDGHTFMRRLAALELDCVVIVSSADGQMDDVIEAMRNGAIDYVKKPWSPSNVLAAVARGLEIHGKRVAVAAPAAAPLPAPAAPVAAPPAGLAQILERIKRGEILLPSLPKAIQELRTLVTDRDSDLGRVAKLVELDQALTARVLQLGRSAMYGSSKPDQDLKATIARIGLQTLHAVVETVWVNGCFQSRDPRFVPYARRLAKFGVARAIAARRYALHANLSGSVAYYGGLFADVGASFLLHVVVEKSIGTPPEPDSVLGFIRDQHEAIGAMLLTQWGHGEDVVARARAHHAPIAKTSHDYQAMVCTLATSTAKQLTAETDLTGDMPTDDQADQCARALGLTEATRDDILDAAYIELQTLLEVL